MINALTHLVNILPSTPERWFVWHDQLSYTFGEHSNQYTRKVVCLTWSTLLHIWWTFYPVHQKGGLFDMINALTHLVNILTSTPERWFVWHDQLSYTFGEHSNQYTRKVVCLTWSMLLHIWWTFYPVHQKGGLFDMINTLTHLVNILPSTPERWFVWHDQCSYTFGEYSNQYTRKVASSWNEILCLKSVKE
jgi:predicted AAA+ superfamily ATPase